jgi:hypothetical protein
MSDGQFDSSKSDKSSGEHTIEVEGTLYEVVWDGARPSPWGGHSKGELMPPYTHRKHLTVESKVG